MDLGERERKSVFCSGDSHMELRARQDHCGRMSDQLDADGKVREHGSVYDGDHIGMMV